VDGRHEDSLAGWRYSVPRFDVLDDPVGLVVDPRGAIDTVADDDAVRQSLLCSSPRGRASAMRPDYG
jgi:hypothetical protein